jgi:general secretion pathway protein K
MKRTRRGYILVQALVAVAGLVAFMAILAADQRASLNVVNRHLDAERAQAAADAGVARALAVLSSANPDVVTQNDDWYKLGNSGDDEFDFDDGSSFRMQIVDACSMLNLNTASNIQLTSLPLDQDQVDSLLDWVQPALSARPDGAKDDFYNGLPQPYNTKLAALTTVDELLLVNNWTAQTLYQPPTLQPTTTNYPTDQDGNYLPLAAFVTVDSLSPMQSASGQAMINISTARRIGRAGALNRAGMTDINRLESRGLSGRGARLLAAQFPISSFHVLFQKVPNLSQADQQVMLNNTTFSTATTKAGLYNINTASQGVLDTLPNMTDSLASSIVQQQASGFTSLGAIVSVSGMSRNKLMDLADSLTVASNTWIARIYGQCGGANVAYEAVIRNQNSQVQIVNLNRLNTAALPSWWAWDSEPTATLQDGDLAEQSQ